MEKFSALFKLGIKYLFRYKRRYGFLLAAIVFGFAVVTFITSSKDGMYDSVYYSAQSHYAGDITAIGWDSQININHLDYDDISVLLDAADESEINPEYIVFRTILWDKGVVYFNGNAVNLKYVVGSDWEAEKHLFSKMTFVSPPEFDIGDDGIILSSPVAQKLGAVVGDSVILETEIHGWQKNTGVFIVRGIVRDSSIFGYYKLYISRVTLNRLLLFNDDDCSVVGFFFNDISAVEQKRALLQNILAEKIQTGPLVYNREEMVREASQAWNGRKVFLYTMSVYLSEISDLLGAMNIVTYFIYGMMLIIILVSAAVTYRLILNERSKEMGIMRAIGFYGGDLRFVLWVEVTALGIISLSAGFLLARLLSFAASFFSFSWFPSFEIFLKNGKLSILYLPKTVLLNVTLIFVVLALAALFPSFRASKKHLPSLLAGEPV
jgi:ABC-type antimicrobial peptide transport system permease subunit